MRLYELAGHQFQDDIATLLRAMQGNADDNRTQSVILWPAINNMMRAQGYGDVGQDMMEKIQDQIDPNGELIQDITDKGIVLKTKISSPEQSQTDFDTPDGGKTIDQMAHNAVRKGL